MYIANIMRVVRLSIVLFVLILFSCKKTEEDKTFKIIHLKPNRVYTTADSLTVKGSFSKRRNDFFVVKNYNVKNEQHKIKIDSFVIEYIEKDSFLTTYKNSSWSLTFFKYGDGINESTENQNDTDYTIHDLFSYKKEIGSFHFNTRLGYSGSNYRVSPEKVNTNKRIIISDYFKDFNSIYSSSSHY